MTTDSSAHTDAGSRLSQAEGLFYAELTHPLSGDSLRVALHGISNYEQASKAISLLTPPWSGAEQGHTAALEL